MTALKLIGVLLVLVGVWAAYTALYEGTLEQPAYTVLTAQDGVEVRRYDPFVVASTPMARPGKAGLNGGFRELAGYIFGGNQPGESLDMTVPVLQQSARGESLPMTAPVLQSPQDLQMAFVMPADRTMDDLPTPDSDRVSLATVDWGEVAALGFAGRGRQATFQATEAELRAALDRMGRTPAGPALYAQYNSPSAFPPLRRNEVLIPLAPR
jgi:hypothetical protein